MGSLCGGLWGGVLLLAAGHDLWSRQIPNRLPLLLLLIGILCQWSQERLLAGLLLALFTLLLLLPGWLAGLLGGGDVKLLVGGVMPLSLSLLLLVLQRLLLLLLLLALLLLLWQLYLQWRATGRWQFATALMMSRRQRLPFAPLLVLALFSGVGIA